MTTARKISSCVDCATTIIGDRLRCPACHDRHAENLLSGVEDVTPRRKRASTAPSVREALIAWLGTMLILVVVVVLLVIAKRSCQ